MSEKYYITTAIAYPNGDPHIGYAYELVLTDALARFQRLDGNDVYFLTGTDEHGIKMLQTATAKDIPVKDFAHQNSERFRSVTKTLNISNDDFIRTSEERHYESVQEIWRRMLANGDIYEDSYSGWYSVRDEAYFDESELSMGEGSQRLSPTGSPVEWVEEPSFFFKLSAYQDKLIEFYEANPDFIGPRERRNEVVSFVKSGLKDLSVSRTTFDWGVPVPDQPGHVMYVWVDALTNYITGLGFPNEDDDRFKSFWPANVHIIGKDIIRFHAVYWPAFLMSAGLDVPHRVYGHGFLTVDGQKMSKSLGNVIDPFALVEEFGVDPLRYYFLSAVNSGQDGDFSREKLINKSNADLANDYGNLAQRSLSMIAKNCDGKVPQPGDLTADDETLLKACEDAIEAARAAMARQHVHDASAAIWSVIGDANRYFAAQEPWALKKTDPARMNTVLYVTAETVRCMSIAALAFVPDSAAKILDALAVPDDKRVLSFANDSGKLEAGADLPAPQPVFKRFEKDAAE